jgi:enoyl-CoA hydratase
MRNALSMALAEELGAALAAFESDEALRAIVLTGNDEAFGADIHGPASLRL